LNIRRNKISDGSVDIVVAMIQSNRTFDRLDLSRNQLSDQAKQIIRKTNTNNNTIRSLIL
jgi:hypothetical protein